MNSIFRVKRSFLLWLFALLTCTSLHAQDTLVLDINAADKIFLEKNLYLLAGQLNISQAKAAEIQARLYPNPQVSGEVNMIDPDHNKWFHTGATGETVAGVEQLILLGGKRRKEIDLAKSNTAVAALELEDLLRNLKQELHNSMYAVHFDLLTLNKYNTELLLLDSIIANYDVQVGKGNISPKEAVRLKSAYLKLNSDRTQLMQDIVAEQQQLSLLLQTSRPIVPIVASDITLLSYKLPSLDSLLAMADAHRPDVKIAKMNQEIAALNIRYQKSLAVPDLTVGSNYDQWGGAFHNQVNLTLGLTLPTWHRNQGNIKAAHVQQQIADVQQQLSESVLNTEVKGAYANMQLSQLEFAKSHSLYDKSFREVSDGILENFLKRNISILEFTDFFESYNETIAALNQARKQVAQSAEAINYTTGTSVF